MKIPDWARGRLSGQKNEVLQKLADREAARQEVENTRWYKMLRSALEDEFRWAERELRHVSPDNLQRLQGYVQSLELLSTFTAAQRLAEPAAQLLKERFEAQKELTVDEFMEFYMGAH